MAAKLPCDDEKLKGNTIFQTVHYLLVFFCLNIQKTKTVRTSRNEDESLQKEMNNW